MKNISELQSQKVLLIEEVSESLEQWDGSSENAVEVLASNEPRFIRMKEIDQELPQFVLNEMKEKLQEQWTEILTNQRKLIRCIQRDKMQLQNQMNQVGKKDKVVSSYIAMKKSSLFVDKDL